MAYFIKFPKTVYTLDEYKTGQITPEIFKRTKFLTEFIDNFAFFDEYDIEDGETPEIVYRSSWELKFMKWCDTNDSVLEWGSEITVIPYRSPVDNKIHRYFVDFYIKVKDKSGNIKKYLIEIKPEKLTKPPPIPKKKTKRFIEEVFMYGTNQAKWKQANEYCLDKGWQFLVLTEKDLGIEYGNSQSV